MKKQAAMIAICAALLLCVAAAGCTSTTSSSPNASAAANSSSQTTTASATPTPTPTPPPTHLTVLFFYEPDCPYCQALESTTSFHQLENTSKVTVTPIESYTSSLTDQYNVTTIPTLILLNNGHEVSRYVDPTDASAINAQIASLFRAK
jgi:thioredoxin-like negative regulator of GroEL